MFPPGGNTVLLYSKVTYNLVYETSRAFAQETVLNGLITAEEKSRQNADKRLGDDIAQEILDRRLRINL